MNYKGFDIRFEGGEHVAFDEDTGERFIGSTDLESLKAYIDKAYIEAEQALAQNG